MRKDREMLVNQIFALLGFAVDLSSKEILVESDYGTDIWARE